MHRITWHTPRQAEPIWSWLHSRMSRPGTVESLVPSGFESYVSIPNSRDPEDDGCTLQQYRDDPIACPDGRNQLDRLLDVLDPATGRQPIHCAIWEGFGGMFGEADGTVRGAAVGFFFDDPAEDTPAARRTLEARWRESRPLRPAHTTLNLPARRFHTWTTTLDDLRADSELLDGFSPSIVVPDDHSWLWHSEIDDRRTEIGGPAALLTPLLGDDWGGVVMTPPSAAPSDD
ncbi:MAG: hypothetical protein QM809_05675 [Gordonia sp. (in: high G+C Gram-positive bacteria)]|uniref:hypothetical protein n=1 Tax=Gordonia sp. (in: high G+C Gram-positive bacteria) TaxID=84139 RepID=UPI0039E5E107